MPSTASSREGSQSPEADVKDPQTSKRKRTAADVDAKIIKKAKKKRAKKAATAAEAEDEDINEETQINKSIGHMNPPLLADHIARQVKRFQPALSLVEHEDLQIPQNAFVDTTSWTGPRTCDKLPGFLERYAGQSRKHLSASHASKGSPHTLVICPAAVRAADVKRALSCYQSKDATVAKLFAKHIKLREAVEFTQETRISIGVGTPQRLWDLVDAGALSLDYLQRIVVDGSWSGPKKRTIFEMAEALVPSARFLARQEVRKRMMPVGKEVSILVF